MEQTLLLRTSRLYGKSFRSLLMLSLVLAATQIMAQVNLQITEIFPGQSGPDLTEDWFEIKNTGNTPGWLV